MSDKEKSKVQFAKIEIPFGAEIQVHCPICGHPTIDRDEDEGTAKFSKCKHLAFIFVGELGEFECPSKDFKKRTKKVDVEDLDFDTLPEYLQSAGYGNNLLALELTYGGIACGPVWFTDVFGFDYGTMEAE